MIRFTVYDINLINLYFCCDEYVCKYVRNRDYIEMYSFFVLISI